MFPVLPLVRPNSRMLPLPRPNSRMLSSSFVLILNFFSILRPAPLLLLFPTLSTLPLINYFVTMYDTLTTSQVTVPQLQQALSQIANLQQAALYEISQLDLPRPQVLEMEVQLQVPNLEALCDGYVNQDICQLS